MALQEYFSTFDERDWQVTDHESGDTIRIALIGLGVWTIEQAIPAIEESDFCETTVVVSSSNEKAASVAADVDTVKHGITYEEYHDGVATDSYDAVYICTPNATHSEYAKTAAEFGKAVLCEKPMEINSERADRMVTVCEETDTLLMIAYRMQTEPAVRRARDLIRDGFIGEPVHVHGHMSDLLLESIPDPDQWRLRPELSGGCSLIDIGLYSLNTTRFLLDDDPISVYGSTNSQHELFRDVDERATFQLEFPKGVTAACSASHNGYESSFLSVVGTDGEVKIEPAFFPWTDRRLTVKYGGTMSEFTFDQVNQMTEEFDYFADCLLSDRNPVPDGLHGLRDIEIIEAIYESAEAGTRITV